MKCKRCLTDLPVSEFYASNRSKCKPCVRKAVLEHRASNLLAVRAYDRLRSSQPHRVAASQEYRKTTAYAESHEAAAKRWAAKHPERKSANTAVGNAVRDGRLTPWPCEVCGAKAHAHHPHYGAPLLVTWLCPPHHKAAHALTEAAA